MLHIAANEDMEINNLDVSNAYLEAPLDVEIYMELPQTEWIDGKRTVVRLLKSLYGLKQSGELWNKRISGILTDFGFKRTKSDPCIYVKIEINSGKTLVGLFVDDILYAASNLGLMKKFEEHIASRVRKVSLLGEVKKFLGMEITRDRTKRTITLTQTDYIKELIKTENVTKKANTPARSSIELLEIPPGELPPMRSIVGKCRYPADRCHPGTLYIMSTLGSVQIKPAEEHLKAAKRVVEYLHKALEEGITLGGTDPIKLEAFVDASLRGIHGQLGLCLRLSKDAAMILSRSIKDGNISFSTTEAELRAFVAGVFEVLWARYFLEELGYPQIGPTPVYEDNSAVVTLMETLASPSGRTKHLIKMRCILQQFIDSKQVSCIKIRGTHNPADIFTKALDVTKFSELNNDITGGRLRLK